MSRAKKSLGLSRGAKAKWGQNFLSDPKILAKIANSAEIKETDTVLEIGPGKGSLTTELLKRAKKVITVEKDNELAEELKEKFAKEIKDGKLEIVVDDILEYEPDVKSYKLVGNIPYYITGEIFRKFLEIKNQPESITFIIQKEVADRILARNNKESILSISIKAYGKPKYGGMIRAGSFSPRPKVDSAIISIQNISKDNFTKYNIKEKDFFDIVHAGFAHKRKLLIKNLTTLPKVTFDTRGLVEIFDKLGIDKKIRAEDLRLEDWFLLARNIL